MSAAPDRPLTWAMGLQWSDLPAAVQEQARRCLKDLLATAAGSLALPAGEQAARLVREQYAAGPAPLWFRAACSSAVGAAFANAFAVDSLDCHDGFRPNKGHCGATVVPVALGACADADVSGTSLLTAVVLGYEIASRAGLALHELYSPAYHASGAWASLGAAAAAAYLVGVKPEEVDGLLGMAEYYAPIAPILRVTEHPAPVKDAAAAGAWAAAMAVSMHRAGMDGIPSLLSCEEAGRRRMASLGEEWLILKQYFKPYPSCRWAQPVVEGVLLLQRRHGFAHGEIRRIDVETFREGADLIAFPPEHSDGAQYSTPWAVAVALVDGKLGLPQVHPDRLGDPRILALGRKVSTHPVPDLSARFPAECLARVIVTLADGTVLHGGEIPARGDHDSPLSDAEMRRKFLDLTEPTLGVERAAALEEVLDSLAERPAGDLVEFLST